MAIREINPKVTTSPEADLPRHGATTRNRRLSLVPPLSQLTVRSITDESRDTKSFMTICAVITTFGLMTMFGLNMALTEGAFKVRELKLQVIEMKELRQAALTEVAQVSAPDRLAQSARNLGMVPSGKPRFIEIESR